ncbi:MAG TPA: hypothetical protein VMH39_00550, partial [Gemmatimonadaceae bacterium]|nr:hypothetical protein [Gemmatimonadaceae bacterium]
MRIVAKLTVALLGGTCVVLAFNGGLRVSRERAHFEEDRIRDRVLIGRSLSAAAAAIWKSNGQEAAIRAIEAVNASGTSIRVEWLPSDTIAREVGARTGAPVASGAVTRTVRDPGGLVWKTDVPLEVDGTPHGFLELSEAVTAEHHFVQRAIEDTSELAIALA